MDIERETRDFLDKEISAEFGLFFEPERVVGRAYFVFKFIKPKTTKPKWLRIKTSKDSFISQIETRVQQTDLDEAFSLVLIEAVKVHLLTDTYGKVLQEIPSDLQQFRFRTGDRDLSATFKLLAIFAAAAHAHQSEIMHYQKMAESFDSRT